MRPGFTWGVATSAYQIEGAADADGRGESIWDRFRARTGDTGAVACDFYHRFRGDVELMSELGVDAFRFSVAWPRVLPEGRGRVNVRGLDFYDRLVDTLLAQGIEPYANLFHWDLPQRLQDEGGWPERATAECFAEYAAVVVARLGDRVTHWSTHNEPYCAAWLGYGLGVHAPGGTSTADAFAAAHHVLLSHGLAVPEVRRHARAAEVGIIVDSWPAHPASDDPGAVAAALAADGVRNRWFFDALLRGAYPEDVLERYADVAPPVRDGDLATIATPLDWLGVNNYSRTLHDAAGRVVRAATAELTATGWEIYPDGLREVLCRLHTEYAPPPLYVTEFGAAFDDVRTHDGRIHDVDRIAYLARSVDAIDAAIAAGVDVRGAFVWSLLDNFEWAEGYSKRFGLVYVDYPTLQRIPKSSFAWYRDLVAARRGPGVAGARAPVSTRSEPGRTAVFLAHRRTAVVEVAAESLARARLPHYAAAGSEQARSRLERLYDAVVDAVAARDVGSLLAYVGRLSDERHRDGYDLGETQTAFNVLEEAIWELMVAELPPADCADGLAAVSSVLGLAKDALARRYVELAAGRAPVVDVEALFAGTERR